MPRRWSGRSTPCSLRAGGPRPNAATHSRCSIEAQWPRVEECHQMAVVHPRDSDASHHRAGGPDHLRSGRRVLGLPCAPLMSF
jgi:hypothetical protein